MHDAPEATSEPWSYTQKLAKQVPDFNGHAVGFCRLKAGILQIPFFGLGLLHVLGSLLIARD